MSEPVHLASAQAVEEEAADWIERSDGERWDEVDEQDLDRWLAQSPIHRVTYLRLKAAWNRADRLIVLRPQAGNNHPVQSRRRPGAMRVAVGLLLLIASTTAVGDFNGWFGNVYTTGLGEHRRITLADGTHVELNTDTVLRERMTTGLRTVTLERGEAYFEVRHDRSRPFVVQLGQHSVTDIGTKFFVRRDAARLSVGVTEGRIEFETSGDTYRAKPLLLGAGSMVVATPRRIVLSTPSAEALSSELAWRSGMLVFNHTTLAEAVAEFNRYNREKLVIADPRASRLLIGGSFRTNDVKLFARVAQDLLGVHVKDKPGEQVISR